MRDLYELIRDIIYDEVTYLRHYIGEVVDNVDPLKKGRVKIAVAELGLDTQALGLWCFPRQGMGLQVPKIKSYAEIYFINGDRTRPVYIYPASEIVDNTPLQFDGKPTNKILFESPTTGEYIKYDEETKKLEVKLTETQIDLEGNNTTNIKGNNTVSIEGDVVLDATGKVDIDSATEINLITGDAATWTPCIIQNCIFSGAPHGGTAAGIIKLKGA